MELNGHKLMGSGEMHSSALRGDTVARTLTVFVKPEQSGKVPSDCKKKNIIPIFKQMTKENPGDY